MNERRLYLDFETQSEADIKKVGGALYTRHPSTSIMCLAYSIDMPATRDHVRLVTTVDTTFRSGGGYLACYAQQDDILFVAHNALFEQSVWEEIMVKRHGFPQIPQHRWRCTMAKAYSHGLPGSLEKCAQVLKLPVQKDMVGNAAMKKLMKPNKQGYLYRYDDCPADWEAMYEYCKDDVIVEQLIDERLRDLRPAEQQVWFIDQQMNKRGLQLDQKLIRLADSLITEHKAYIGRRLKAITGGVVDGPTKRIPFKAWLLTKGVKLRDTQATTLKKELETNKRMPRSARRVIKLYLAGNKTSLAKYKKMIERSDVNGIIREILVFHGAHTGRFTGRGAQLHNLPRPRDTIAGIIECLKTFKVDYANVRFLYPNVADALATMLRGTIVARHGHRLLIGDYAQIEARIIAWLAGQTDTLEIFAKGEDVYCMQASKLYGRTITPDDRELRQSGKVSILSLGFGGGIAAVGKMSKGYEMELLDLFDEIWKSSTPFERDRAEWSYQGYLRRCKRSKKKDLPLDWKRAFVADVLKQRWRAANPAIVRYWGVLEMAAIEAVMTGHPVDAGDVRFFTNGVMEGKNGKQPEYLHIKLPSGRVLSYYAPRLRENKKGKVELSYMGHQQNKWIRIKTYGGKLAENVTQAIGADLLMGAMRRLDKRGYQIILHGHDEMVVEMPKGQGTLEEFSSIFASAPKWSEGLPIEVECREGRRYGKSA